MSVDRLAFTIEDPPSEMATHAIAALLDVANRDAGHDRNRRVFAASLRGPGGDIEGGIVAQAFWEWLYIAELAISVEWRGRGYGRQLLQAAEAWGIDNGCRNAWLMTMSFQSRAFYERADYRVFAELGEYPSGESRLFLRKALVR